MFIRFDRQGSQTHPDFLERLGNITFDYFLSGRRYVVEPLITRNKFSFRAEVIRSKALAVFLSFITLPAKLVGVVAYHFSSTYQETYKDFVRQNNASIRIQQLWQKHKQCKQSEAATKIQKFVRGYLTRKAFINCDLISDGSLDYEAYGTSAWDSSYACIPTARSKVYLPRQLPQLVLKYFGSEKTSCKERALRVRNMLHVRKFLSKIRSRHLIVPRIYGYKRFLIEERLPISPESMENLWIYQSSPSAFDTAVLEMVRLSRYVTFHGLYSMIDNPYSTTPKIKKTIRYDKIPLFIETQYLPDGLEAKIGKIGLVHLEDVEMKPQEHAIEFLTYIFPYHSRLICEEARRLGIVFNERERKRSEIAGKEFIHVMFTRHRKWLCAKEISVQNNLSPVKELTSAQFSDLSTHLAERLEKYLAKQPILGCLGNRNFVSGMSSEDMLRIGEDAARLLLNRYKEEISCYHEEASRSGCTTEAELLVMRAPTFVRERFWKDVLDVYYLEKIRSGELKLQGTSSTDKNIDRCCVSLSLETLDWFLDWLVQEGHILRYTAHSREQYLPEDCLWLQY